MLMKLLITVCIFTNVVLQAILSRKLNVPEIHELMKKVEEMSITADSPHVRRECRQVSM